MSKSAPKDDKKFPVMRHTYLTAEQDKMFAGLADKLGWSYSQFLRRAAEAAAEKMRKTIGGGA